MCMYISDCVCASNRCACSFVADTCKSNHIQFDAMVQGFSHRCLCLREGHGPCIAHWHRTPPRRFRAALWFSGSALGRGCSQAPPPRYRRVDSLGEEDEHLEKGDARPISKDAAHLQLGSMLDWSGCNVLCIAAAAIGFVDILGPLPQVLERHQIGL